MNARRYALLGETAERYELVNGVVLMAPSASYAHNRMAAEVMFQLLRFAEETGEVVAVHETDVRFSDLDVYRPDIVAYKAARVSGRPDQLRVPPDLVVEVLSGARKPFDLITKRDDYQRFGVREYWVVDPESGSVRCWRRRGKRFVEVRVRDETLRCAALPGFGLDLTRLRALVGPIARKSPARRRRR